MRANFFFIHNTQSKLIFLFYHNIQSNSIMSSQFPSTPKNLHSIDHPSQEEPDPFYTEEWKQTFDKALNKGFDNLFYQICHNLGGNFTDPEHPLKSLWQDKIIEYSHTSPHKRFSAPQLYLRLNVSQQIDILNGPNGPELDIPLNKDGNPIKFTAATILSQNSSHFRQYVNDQEYLPPGLCLLIFRHSTQDWTYNIIITRDKNSTHKCHWDTLDTID